MSTNRIGWIPADYTFAIKAGSSGAYSFTITAQQADGSALPTYDGWTAVLALFGPYARAAALTKSPTVTGDSGAKTLTFDLVFDPADTVNLTPANYIGSVWMTDPTDDGMYCPAVVTLTVENHNS
jgi:hypothetical protein